MLTSISRLASRPARLGPAVVAAAALAVGAAVGAYALDGWLRLPEEGLAAARKSGKPVLVGTCWKPGICNSCDTWRARVRKSDDVQKALRRFETVEWLYDGLGGDVIEWTRRHGGESDDPSAQVFVLSVRGDVMARAPDRVAYTPAKFAKWLNERADAHEADHPSTAMPFERAEVVEEREDTTRDVRLPALEAAMKARRPVLVFVGRDARKGDEKHHRTRAKAARRFAKTVLDSKAAAKAAEGWLLLKLDRSVDLHAEMAWNFGIAQAPVLLLFAPGAALPKQLPANISSQSLAYQLEKHRPKATKPDKPK